ncbi:MAG: Na+/proline symporter/nitrogen-specific signal transduction histidine kinase [Parasphingorhabdus sp.]|jgi:Na+/proline symporter/nitrogen-specific signal transduction histidine kinase
MTLTTNLVLFIALAYVALLFLLAYISDRASEKAGRNLLHSPWIYTLSISVYCTSWTFYGAVGSAVRNGLEFITIYLGPTLVFVGWWFLLRKLVRIGQVHRITSIADLISSRFGKSTTIAALVTVIAVVASTPYISLQLKAVTTSFYVVSNFTQTGLLGSSQAAGEITTGFWVAVAMAAFTILFGTRNLDANEQNPGVVAAIAFEALIKLIAIIAVGSFVVFGIAGGVENTFNLPSSKEVLDREGVFGARWFSLMVLSAIAVVCLPRQFQVTVVENTDPSHLRTASWAFPLYLLLISLFVLPIAIVGLAEMPVGSDPDMFVLTLPLSRGQDALAMFVFIGGFSSATSMVIVASIALSIMLSNHIVVPMALRYTNLSPDASGDIKKLILTSRRISIAVVLLLGYLYFYFSTHSDALASIGLIAFTGVAQFFPALVLGIFWRRATGSGVVAGLSAGFFIWIYTLYMPSFQSSSPMIQELVREGLFGWSLLKPQALLGMTDWDPLVHAIAWSLCANSILIVLVSMWTRPEPLERLQGALFVDVFRNSPVDGPHVIQRQAATKDLYILAQRILGPVQAHQLFTEHGTGSEKLETRPPPDARFIAHIERRLAGTIGAATARTLVSQIATGETISLDEIIKLVDETHQAVEYSHRLEAQSAQLKETAGKLQKAYERLQLHDQQKDEFLSQVSHEVRTPMTSIRSFAEILLDGERLNDEDARRFIGIIHEESIRLTRLLDEILEINYLEEGQHRMANVAIYPEIVLNRAVESIRGLASQEGIRIQMNDRVESAIVMGDSDRLHQVIINLLNNAIKYNTTTDPFITVSSEIQKSHFLLKIRDNGPGVEEPENIFEKFTRGRGLSGRGSTGSGLGLPISREIIRRMNGELSLVDAVNTGACFQIDLPLADSSEKPG